jgi:hypothetical protein
MTSLAFILGVVPLVVASGAGAEMRHSLGTAVFSGMLGVTLFGIFLTPVFFAEIDRFAGAAIFQNRLVRRGVFLTFGAALGLGVGVLLLELGVVWSLPHWLVLSVCSMTGAAVGELVVRGHHAIVPAEPADRANRSPAPGDSGGQHGERQP